MTHGSDQHPTDAGKEEDLFISKLLQCSSL